MDILEGPILLACSAVTGLYALWQQKYQQGRIRLPDQRPWREQPLGAIVRTTHLVLITLGLGLLISVSNLVAVVVLLIKQEAWAGQTSLGFQERNRPRFSNPLRLFWICSLILSTVSFSLWIRHRSETDLYLGKPFATLNRITTIARFVQSIGLVLLGLAQEIQLRALRSLDLTQDRAPSSQSSRATLVQDSLVGASAATSSKKSKKHKSGTGPGGSQSASAQKDYKRPTTFKEFYGHCTRLRPYIWPSNSRKLQIHILLCLALLVIGRVVNVLVPQQLAKVVNALRQVSDGATDENGNPRFIWMEIMIFIGLRALQGSIGAVDTLQGLLWIPVGQFNTRELAVKMFEHLLNLSLRFHLNRKTGEMLRVQDRGVSSIVTLLSSLLFNILPCLVDIAVACIFLTRAFDIYFGIIVFITMMCYIYATILMTDWRTRYRRESNALDNAVEARAVDSLLNYETIKLFATEEYEVGKYTDAIHAYQKADRKSQYTLGILNTTLNVVIQGGLALGCLLCAKRIAQKEMEVDDFVMYYAYITQLYGPLNLFGTSYRSLQKNFIDMEKMLDLFQEPVEIQDLPEAKSLTMTGGEVVFENVSFGYNPQNPNLKSVSFKVPHGKKLALVGPSGGGKSTILRLLFRFYDPTQGRILIDGQDIRMVTQSSLRRKIGIVPQDTALFNESIGYNIGYGKIGQDQAQVFDPSRSTIQRRRIQSGESSGAESSRRVLLSGKPTKPAGRGRKSKNASLQSSPETADITEGDEDADVEGDGGEYEDDEDWEDDGRIQAAAEAAQIHEIISRFPEAALDTQTERDIQNSIESISKDRTTLMIAHRLSTIVDADEILVIQKGEIAEQGSHEELMQAGGIYAAMWMQQLREDRTPAGSSHSSQKDSSKGEEESDEDDSSDDDDNARVGKIRIRRSHHNNSNRYPRGTGTGAGYYGDNRAVMSFSLPVYGSNFGSGTGSSSGSCSGDVGPSSSSRRGFMQGRLDWPSINTTMQRPNQLTVLPESDSIQEVSDENSYHDDAVDDDRLSDSGDTTSKTPTRTSKRTDSDFV
ncbi:Homocysteine S-methyltransferase 1 [Linnemannia schmuckeri]|uniref:Homocysteine S-methyltransferase 1 n=1 Tax=Linnemannia schmuckeri TaxID=64567 RepID=A0A9P5VE69_9FUNG|nr:Homocysteine S-methyltransferase 1 [Linnemannia schmuckeri]